MGGEDRIDLEMVVGHIGDYTDDAILITEAEPVDRPGRRILWANAAFCRMTGYAMDEVIGQTPKILQGERTDEEALSLIRNALKEWKPVRVEVKNYRKDGTPFYVDLGIQPVTDSTGWHHYWIAIQRETTERHEREQLLRRTTRIIDGAPIALGLLSVDNRLTFANAHFKQLIFGDIMSPALPLPYESWLRRSVESQGAVPGGVGQGAVPGAGQGLGENAGQDVGQDLGQDVGQVSGQDSEPGADSTAGRIGLDWVRRHLGGLFSTPARIEQKIGTRWHEFRRIATASGDQLVIGEDIEDRIRLQEQLRHMTKLDAMGQLTSGVAHDFNNILAVILGSVELLQMDEEAEGDRDLFISEAVSAVLKGRSLTQSLLSFARKSHMSPAVCGVGALCQETVDMFRRTSAAAIAVRLDIAADIPDIHVDPNMFQNALLNILINARDAMPAGGDIRITARMVPGQRCPVPEGALPEGALPDGAEPEGAVPAPQASRAECVEIDVRDHGEGMPPHTLRHAIEPFFTTKDKGTGSGLGLSMVHGFVEQCGGSLSVTSQPGEGTLVRMRFPAERRAGKAEPQVTAQSAVLPGIRILLVEDEAAVRKLLCRTLEKAGARVTAMDTGDAAVAMTERWGDFDLLLTDILMPGHVQGDMLALRFAEHCPKTPIILLSGNPEVLNSARPSAADRTIVLSKPVLRNVLIDHIAALCANRDT
jgi:PAS domain S-box-containing protein